MVDNQKKSQNNRPKAVNWHIEAYCNYDCGFCYAPFEKQRRRSRISLRNIRTVLLELADSGVEKINFVGGEPMLHPFIDQAIIESKRLGMTTSIVSNGTGMDFEWLNRMSPHLDWLGLSIDAPDDEIHAKMGRGRKGEIAVGKSKHLDRCLEVWEMGKILGFGLKLNTMVNSQNINSDMSDLVRRLSPTRWKIFQFLHIIGENDSAVSNGVGAGEFRNYVTRHKKILEDTGIGIISEENREMLGSYAMIDPTGRAYTNISGIYHYSSHPIHEVGFLDAWADVCDGFDNSIFKSRGGEWNWNSNQKGLKLPMLEESRGGVIDAAN